MTDLTIGHSDGVADLTRRAPASARPSPTRSRAPRAKASMWAATALIAWSGASPALATRAAPGTAQRVLGLTPAQRATVNAAIGAIGGLGGTPADAREQASVTATLNGLMARRPPGICRQTNTGDPAGGTTLRIPGGGCGAAGPLMNIREDALNDAAGGAEPAFSILIGILFHEATHANNWIPPGPPGGGAWTPTALATFLDCDEVNGYEAEARALRQRIITGGLGADDRAEVIKRRQLVLCFRDYYEDKKKPLGNPPRTPLPHPDTTKWQAYQNLAHRYVRDLDNLAAIQVFEPDTPDLVATIETPFEFITDFAAFEDPGQPGSTALVVAGIYDPGSLHPDNIAGGVVTYTDDDKDAIPDSGSLRSLGPVTWPARLQYVPPGDKLNAQVYVLERVNLQVMGAVADGAAQLPRTLQAAPVLDLAAQLGECSAEVADFRVVDRTADGDGIAFHFQAGEFDGSVAIGNELLRFVDRNLNLSQDADEPLETLGGAELFADLTATLLSDPQVGDTAVTVIGAAGRDVHVWTVDPDTDRLLALLGRTTLKDHQHLTRVEVKLHGRLAAGDTLALTDGKGTLEHGHLPVVGPRPEIAYAEHETYKAGENVLVIGRRLAKASVVDVGGTLVTPVSVDEDRLIFRAPDLPTSGTTLFDVAVCEDNLCSRPIGIHIEGTGAAVAELRLTVELAAISDETKAELDLGLDEIYASWLDGDAATARSLTSELIGTVVSLANLPADDPNHIDAATAGTLNGGAVAILTALSLT